MRGRGVCKWFNETKGFGFITLSDGSGRDVFVHFSEIESKGYKKLAEGDMVECVVEKGPKGLRASDVIVIVGCSHTIRQGPAFSFTTPLTRIKLELPPCFLLTPLQTSTFEPQTWPIQSM